MAMVSVHAQKTPVWLDPEVNQVNREARHAHFFAFENEDLARQADKAKSARFLSMEGMWKFNFVKDHQNAPEGFFGLKYDDSQWVDFPVPGLFELNGYGDPIYKNIGYAWGTTFKSNPPYIGETNNYTGSYRRTFELPQDWNGQEVFFHVGSATSNLTLWVNGKYVGEGGRHFQCRRTDIARFLHPGVNRIALKVRNERSFGGVICDLYVRTGGEERFFHTDGDWRCAVGDERSAAVDRPVVVGMPRLHICGVRHQSGDLPGGSGKDRALRQPL